MRSLLLLLLVSLLVAPALAGPPAIGTWIPIDGRFTESWNGGEGQVGNTLHAGSWDGATLAGQWLLHCPAMAYPPTEQENTINDLGFGFIKYHTTYAGGSLWLSRFGPWGDGTVDYTSSDITTVVTSTHLYANFARTAVVSDVSISGTWDGYDGCFVYTLANAAIFGAGAPPGVYPAYIDASCTAGGTGAYGDVDDITMVIYAQNECEVAVRETTWGHVKSLYGD